MTITDLKAYAKRINADVQPTDKMSVTLNREATAYISAFLNDRKHSLEQSLADQKISDKKRSKREYELGMVLEAINAITNAKLL